MSRGCAVVCRREGEKGRASATAGALSELLGSQPPGQLFTEVHPYFMPMTCIPVTGHTSVCTHVFESVHLCVHECQSRVSTGVHKPIRECVCRRKCSCAQEWGCKGHFERTCRF